MKKSESIIRKFIDVINIKNWQVKSINENYQTVWNDIKTVNKTIKYDEVKVVLEDGKKINCADDHVFIDRHGREIFAKDSKFNCLKIPTGFSEVKEVKQFKKKKHMYDLSLKVNTNNLYLTNNILSHNTTSYTVFILWMLCFQPNKSVMIAANKAATAIDIMDRVRLAYEYLPVWLKPSIVTYNKSQIVLNTNSRVVSFSTSSSAIRGFSANVVCLDEFAYVPKNIAQEFFQSVVPVLSTDPNSRVIIVSTANGTNNLYYDIWTQALDNKNNGVLTGWQPFRMDWWDAPYRDNEWKEEQINTIGIDRFRVEFGNEFVSGTKNRLLPDNIVDNFKKKDFYTVSVTTNTDEIYNIKIYKKFEFGKIYIAGVDVGEGIGLDNSVIFITDITDMSNIEIAASFASNKLSVAKFASLTSRLLNAYNNPLLLAESNGIGAGYLSALKDFYDYPRIASFDGKKPGVQINSKIKTDACLWMRELLMAEKHNINIHVNDEMLIEELKYFSKLGVGYGAPKGLRDDCVLAFIWNLFLLKKDLLSQGIIVLDTCVLPEIGIELPSKFAYQISENISLPAFINDKLPMFIANIESDLFVDWYLIEGENKIISTSSAKEVMPAFFINTGNEQYAEMEAILDFWNDKSPSW